MELTASRRYIQFSHDFLSSSCCNARPRSPQLIFVSLGHFPMHLVMFDIDGTLTETMKIDEECFVRSFKDVFGFTDIDTDWSHYPHTTDSGIFHDVFTARIGRTPTAREVSRFRQHFIQLLAAASSQSPFAPVVGADGLLSRLASGGPHRVSLATGGWRESARLKMASAGMCFEDYPAAAADDALDRESIMRLSRQRAAERYGESFACTVFVGDGVWDARACRSVGIPFIGIGAGSRATRLSAEGAVCVFPDFSDADIFLRSVYEITNAA
jgi:phosphoglycolate phosphatase-like HAD superfamily hydrolase